MIEQKVEHNEEIFPINVKQTLDQILRKEGYISVNFSSITITKKESYLGILHEADIKGKTKDGDKESCLIIKLPRQIDTVLFTTKDLFIRESYAYSELFKIYEELQDKANIPTEARFKAAKSFEGTSSEAIILENLSRKGFKAWPRLKIVSLIFAELYVKQMAKFHALSVVLRNQRVKYFKSNILPLDNFVTMSSYDKRHSAFINMVNAASKHLTEESKKLVDVVMDKCRECAKHHQKILKTFECLCHGDLKNDNILYKEQDCGVMEVIIIDYQVIYYGPPIQDFIHFIFSGTDREFRRKHLDHLKNLYYTSFEHFLKYFNMDLNVLWSREKFEHQFQECLHYGLIRSLLTFPIVLADNNDIPDFTKEIVMEDFKPDIQGRIQELVDDYIELRGTSCA